MKEWMLLKENVELDKIQLKACIIFAVCILVIYIVCLYVRTKNVTLKEMEISCNIIQDVLIIFIIPILASVLIGFWPLLTKLSFLGISYLGIVGMLMIVTLEMIIMHNFYLKKYIKYKLNNEVDGEN